MDRERDFDRGAVLAKNAVESGTFDVLVRPTGTDGPTSPFDFAVLSVNEKDPVTAARRALLHARVVHFGPRECEATVLTPMGGTASEGRLPR